jgi:hypothetical protein
MSPGAAPASTARLLPLLLLTLPMAGCAVVGGIFKMGFVSAIVVVIVIVAIVAFVARR